MYMSVADYIGAVIVHSDYLRDLIFEDDVDINIALHPAGSGSIVLRLQCSVDRVASGTDDEHKQTVPVAVVRKAMDIPISPITANDSKESEDDTADITVILEEGERKVAVVVPSDVEAFMTADETISEPGVEEGEDFQIKDFVRDSFKGSGLKGSIVINSLSGVLKKYPKDKVDPKISLSFGSTRLLSDIIKEDSEFVLDCLDGYAFDWTYDDEETLKIVLFNPDDDEVFASVDLEHDFLKDLIFEDEVSVDLSLTNKQKHFAGSVTVKLCFLKS
jgi:hypothetical protein